MHRPQTPAGAPPIEIRLAEAIEDVKQALARAESQYVGAVLDRVVSGEAPATAEERLRSLEEACGSGRSHFAPQHLRFLVEPFLAHCRRLGPDLGRLSLMGDPLQTVGMAIRQWALTGEQALRALQGTVDDLFQAVPGGAPASPLAAWTVMANLHPFTQDTGELRPAGVQAGVIGMPRAFSDGGLLAWASLAHEAGGHAVLNGFPGFLDEARARAKQRLARRFRTGDAKGLAGYWDRCFEEAAADALGVLRLGPAMALGFIGAYRAGRSFQEEREDGVAGEPRLQGEDYDESHPSDVMRACLTASVTGRLPFAGRHAWRAALEREIARDVPPESRLGRLRVGAGEIRDAAGIFAEALLGAPLAGLGGLTLLRWRAWTDADEGIAQSLRRALRQGTPPDAGAVPGYRARHVLAGGILAAATASGGEPESPAGAVFQRMMSMLAQMQPTGDRAAPFPPARFRICGGGKERNIRPKQTRTVPETRCFSQI